MRSHRVAKTLLILFFTVQSVIAVVAYRNARVQGEAQRLGWQMFTGHTDGPTFVLIKATSEEAVPRRRVFIQYRSELNDDIVFEDKVFTFLCAFEDNVTAVRVTSGAGETRTESCEDH